MQERLGRLREIMGTRGIDVLVATTPENVAYLTGFFVLTHIRHPMRRLFAILGRQEEWPALVIPTGLLDVVAMQRLQLGGVQTYGPFFVAVPPDWDCGTADEEQRMWAGLLGGLSPTDDSLGALSQVLTRLTRGSSVCALDEGRMTPAEWIRIQRSLPDMEIVPGYDLLRLARTRKFPDEIGRIRAATSVAEQALWEALNELKVGMTELEIARVFMTRVAARGGIPTLTCVGSGPRAGFPTAEPSLRCLRPGDLVRFDVGCLYEGYHSDLARTAVVGAPSPKQESYYRALQEGEGLAIELARAGNRTSEVFQVATERVRREGIPHYKRNHVGHGEGLEGYEPPFITPGSDMVLEEGMVVCLETPYYEVGFGGLQVEDTVVVTARGEAERLTSIPRDLFVVEC